MYLGEIVEVSPAEELYDNPLHPYTISLLSAVPIPDPEVERERETILLAGDLPSPANPPAGCRFHTRCPFVQPTRCRDEEPPLRKLEGRPLVACHWAEEIKAGAIEPHEVEAVFEEQLRRWPPTSRRLAEALVRRIAGCDRPLAAWLDGAARSNRALSRRAPIHSARGRCRAQEHPEPIPGPLPSLRRGGRPARRPRTTSAEVIPLTPPLRELEQEPTMREIEVLQLISDGLVNREIGQRLFLSEETVKSHVRHLLAKLQARSRAHAVAIGFRRGLIS